MKLSQKQLDAYKQNQSGDSRNNETSEDSSPSTDKRREIIAKYLLLIGKKQAAEVLQHLNDKEIAHIAPFLLNPGIVTDQDIEQIQREFRLQQVPDFSGDLGGKPKAREILTEAFGRDKADSILGKSTGTKSPPFAFLSELTNVQLISLLEKETPLVLSIVLPFLKTTSAAAVFETLEADVKKKTALRMARAQSVKKTEMDELEQKFRQRIEMQNPAETIELNGKEVLSGILRHMDKEQESSLMEDLKSWNPDIAEEIEESLFSSDAILKADGKGLEQFLDRWEDEDLAYVVKGLTEEQQESLYRCVSMRRRTFIEEERELLGGIRKSVVNEYLNRFLNEFRNAVENGQIILYSEDEEYV